ncbi:YtxH domain-containing protein [Streptomyces phaeochromogenes]|uniref:YtxH domain-containing protein n=1 Tax=Streptomyces phaeochromogenes TaxID=1923 RepID=A0ABZ1HQZ3_STRPH|nr:YtxH domain-containing protein [Streptomyces phaeochromogenes]WSD21029.1 YtxH domain-containing protein [Streptomyces phaeochromogenes]
MNEQARRTIASYTACHEAERAVDHLSDQGFPVERAAIVGQEVRLVEQVTGRMGHGGAALHGTATGALPGALIGWIFGLLNWLDPVVSELRLALYGLVFGVLIGALLGLLVHAPQRGRRDFASVRFMQPCRYDAVADEAVRLLAELPGGTGADTSSGAWKSSHPRSCPALP